MFLDHTNGRTQESSERVISPRYLLNTNKHTRDEYPFSQRDSKPRSQQSSSCRMAAEISTFLLFADRIRTKFQNVLLNQNQTIKTGRHIHVNTINLLTFKGCETWSLKKHIQRMYDKVSEQCFYLRRMERKSNEENFTVNYKIIFLNVMTIFLIKVQNELTCYGMYEGVLLSP